MDDILLEVRKVREDYAKQFGYDLLAIHRDLKEQERASGRRIVSLPPRCPKPAMAQGASPRTPKVSQEVGIDSTDCRTKGETPPHRAAAFGTAYRELYGYPPPARAIDLESLRVVASSPEEPARPPAAAPVSTMATRTPDQLMRADFMPGPFRRDASRHPAHAECRQSTHQPAIR